MKKLLAMLLTLALVLCPLALAEEGGAPYKVAFICKGYTDMFCLTVMEYVQEHAPEYADTFEVEYFDGEVNTETANTLIENCVTSGFDCIIFQQNDAVAPVEVVKRAVENGVYVIVTTGHIEDDGESYYVDANPYQQGELVMQYAIEQGIITETTKNRLLVLEREQAVLASKLAEENACRIEHIISEELFDVLRAYDEKI